MRILGPTARRIATAAVACGLLVPWVGSPARAQPDVFGTAPGSRYKLSENVRVDRPDSTVQTYLQRVDQLLADGQWDEAVETLREVMEESGGKLLEVTERRLVSVRDFCQLKLASLPPDALGLYRSRVDPVARKWYEDGVAGRDRRLLLNVVEQAFASSWGDDALNALAEMSLEQGDYARARSCWERIVPVDPPSEGPSTWLSFPDTDLDLAAIRARLVLVSLLEGSPDRAAEELAQLARLHPDARGRFGGREVDYVEALTALTSERATWPAGRVSPGWPTFAGSPRRNRIAPDPIDVREVAWRVPLEPTLPAHNSIWGRGAPSRRVAEDPRTPLSYHPLLAGNLVLINNQVEILAVDVETGGPVWNRRRAEIFRDQFDEQVHALYNPPDNLGVPRFTMTAHDGKLYARMGAAVTSSPPRTAMAGGTGYLVCLDLRAQGRLVWKIMPPEPGWAFEGSPVTDGTNLYVALRCSDIQPQAHVGCYDATTGRPRWRQFVCAAETPARGMLHETTHNLLTLQRDTLYYNTNLGAVAALAADDGRLKWVSLYPRVRRGDLLEPAPHWCRDLNPCLFDRGRLLVAPCDSRRIFALDATTGQILWHTGPEVEDAVHLLGVAGDHLIASGAKLYWISLGVTDAGKLKHVWPDGHEKLGYGRGVLAGDCVWWPTREKIYLFDQATGQPKKTVSLVTRGTTGGNLLIGGGYLLIAGSNELVALRQGSPPPQEPAEGLTAGRARPTWGTFPTCRELKWHPGNVPGT